MKTNQLTVRQKEAMRRFGCGSLLLDWSDTDPGIPSEWEAPSGKRMEAGVSQATLDALTERGLITWEESSRQLEGAETRVRYYRLSDEMADKKGLHQCMVCGRPLRPTDDCIPCE